MFSYLKRLGDKIAVRKGNNLPQEGLRRVSPILKENVESMRELFRSDSDFIIREFVIPLSGGIKAAVFFIDGLVEIRAVNESILEPLMIDSLKIMNHGASPIKSMSDIFASFALSAEVKTAETLAEACKACLMGDMVLMADGLEELLYINSKGFATRAISEPQTETVVRGPREGFTETLRVNTSLIRRKLRTPNLRMDTMILGERSNTLICLAYLDNVANPALIGEVKKRLRTIDVDAVMYSGEIEEFIEDSPFSVFQTINYTEKPDIVASRLLEGRCALLVDGTPFVLTMPMLFVECFQSPEDYSVRTHYAVFLRIVRFIAFFISLVAPAVYVALTTFHQEIIPTPLLFTIAASCEYLPFPSMIETSVMLVTFEILKEAGIRLPKPVGQTISIVGALIMGQAAIQAGIVGAPVVIVIAFSAVSNFLAPNISDAVSILRWCLLLLASFMGGFGIVLGLLMILIHLASLESFGAAYLSPFSPFHAADLKDGIVRGLLWDMKTRPEALNPQDVVRQNMSKPEFGKERE